MRGVRPALKRRGLALCLALVAGVALAAPPPDLIARIRAGKCTEARASWWGFDPQDATDALQAAIRSGVPRLVVDRMPSPWIVRPLKARSNQEIIFEDGAEWVAKKGAFHGLGDMLFTGEGVSNLVIRGLGRTGGTFRMHKRDYQKPPYAPSEWRYALCLRAAENVRVENMRFISSGGDGIMVSPSHDGRSSRNIVIRDCVCDDNHRQGISLCGCEDVLIENTVLSNTRGTPPAAGIDFEPDNPYEKLARITLRNVTARNNDGNGFHFFLSELRERSGPVSVTLENCRSEGNGHGVFLTVDNRRDRDTVKGAVTFRDCVFADARKEGVFLRGIPADSVAVTFENCVVSNAAAGTRKADVTISAGKPRQGMPDGMTFDGLTVFQPVTRPWFAFEKSAYGPRPDKITGRVTVVSPDGVRASVALDTSWRNANFPLIDGGKWPIRRVPLPRVADVTVHDVKPGELSDLVPLATVGDGRYLCFVPRPGPVRFVLRQIATATGRTPNPLALVFRYLPEEGESYLRLRRLGPGFEPKEVVFMAPRKGFYTLAIPFGGTRYQLLKSSVPVGVEMHEREWNVSEVDGRPFSLWFDVPVRKAFMCQWTGDAYHRFDASLVDPDGKTAVSRNGIADSRSVTIPTEQAVPGLWRMDVSKAAMPHYDRVRFDLIGVPGCWFLTREKMWFARPKTVSAVSAE